MPCLPIFPSRPLTRPQFELDPRGDDQVVVGVFVALGGHDLVVLGVELGGGFSDPIGPLGDLLGLGALGDLLVEDPASDQGPQRLVIVDLGRLDDADIERLVEGAQSRGDRDSGRSASDDEYLVVIGHGVSA